MAILIAGDKNRYSNKSIAASLRQKGADVHFLHSRDVAVTSDGNLGLPAIPDLIYVRTGFFCGVEAFSMFLLYTFILESFEKTGAQVINSLEAFQNTANKMKCLTLLNKGGVKIPFSAVAVSHENAKDIAEDMGYPVVLKPLFGDRGQNMYLVNSASQLEECFETIGSKRVPVLVQEYLEKKDNRDIRAFVVGDQVVACMYRYGQNDWRTNLSCGGTGKTCPLTDDLEAVALKTARITRSDIVGVDIVECNDDLIVLEVNPLPGLLIQKVTRVNVADKIAGYLIEKAHCAAETRGPGTFREKSV